MKIGKIIFAVAGCLLLTFCASSTKRLAKNQEKDPIHQYNLGIAYFNVNNLDEAIKAFNKSLALNPKNPLAWNALGFAYSIKGNLQEAAESFRKCLELNPSYAEARNNLGMLYQEMGFIDKAEQEFLKALEDPRYPYKENPCLNLARLYLSLDRVDDAEAYIEKAIQIKPRFAMAHNLRGMIMEKKGKFEQALEAFELAVKIVPEDVSFNMNLGLASYRAKNYVKAKACFEKILPSVTDQDTRTRIRGYLEEMKKY